MLDQHTRNKEKFPIETVRAVAIIILVSFHVIGGPDGRGLGLDAMHPLRYYADLLVDLRMPLFAFIAGLVYAKRPVSTNNLGKFLRGKFRRLAIPGAVAMSLFALTAIMTGAASQPPDPVWMMYFSGYSIFWFLQAILVIFFTAVVADIISKGKLLLPMLVGSIFAICFGFTFTSEIMSLDRVTSLLPYFLIGVFFIRNHNFIMGKKNILIPAFFIIMLTGLIMNFYVLGQTGSFSEDRLDLQSFLFGAGACTISIMIFPTIDYLRFIGSYSFTIYLYHIFATTGSRKALASLELDSPYLHLFFGLILGVGLPIILHFLIAKNRFLSQLMLGINYQDKTSRPKQLRTA